MSLGHLNQTFIFNQTYIFVLDENINETFVVSKTIVNDDTNDQSLDSCNTLDKYYKLYLNDIIHGVGFILNLISALVFKSLVKNTLVKGNMFKYLLLKSINDAMVSIRYILLQVFACTDCEFERIYPIQVFNLVVLLYFGFITHLLSILFELAANIDRYFTININFRWCNRITYKQVTLVLILYSFAFYIFKFWGIQIETQLINNTTLIYNLDDTKFNLSNLGIVINFIHSIVRDGLCVLVMFAFNVLTLIKMKKHFDKKNSLISNPFMRVKIKNRRKERTEMKLTVMILVTSLVAIIGHGMMLMSYILKQSSKNKCFLFSKDLLFHSSYTVNFVFYYFFNKSFRNVLKTFFIKLIKCFRVDLKKEKLNQKF